MLAFLGFWCYTTGTAGEMASGARSGLKPHPFCSEVSSNDRRNGQWSPFGIETCWYTTVALLFENGGLSQPRKLSISEGSASREAQLRQVSVQRVSSLLQDSNGQMLIGCQRQVVAVIADLSMSTPGASRGGPLVMSGKVALFAHKAKRGLLCNPGKPLRGIRLKREHAVLGTDHHGASL